MEKVNASHTVGLYLDRYQLIAVSLKSEKGAVTLDGRWVFEIETGADDPGNPLYIYENGKAFIDLANRQLSISALPTSSTLQRRLELKLKKEKAIQAVLSFQAEPLIPYPIEQALLDWMYIERSENASKISLFAARRDHLSNHLERFKLLNIEPEVVASVPAALACYVNFFVVSDKPIFIVYLGQQEAMCTLVQGSTVLAAQSSYYDVNDREGLKQELLKMLYALNKGYDDVEKIVVTGLVEDAFELAEALGKEALIPEEREGFTLSQKELSQFALPIGLALMGLPGSQEQINFRQGDLSYSQPWKRLKKPVALYFISCLLLAWAASFLGQSYLGHKEDAAKEEYGRLLTVMNKPYINFESEYESKYPFGNTIPDGKTATLEMLSVDDLYDRLDFLDHEIDNMPDTIALQPNIPRVSDVLAWLGQHPNVVLKNSGSDDERALIEIETFHYSLVKRPEEKKRNARYQVKVDIEFTSPSPKLARQFHDALIEPNLLVDTKEEVKWSTSRGKYRTSFFLKDKTVYPAKKRSSS